MIPSSACPPWRADQPGHAGQHGDQCRQLHEVVGRYPTVRVPDKDLELKIPFLKPDPPKVNSLIDGFLSVEQSGIFTNFGPQNTQFEDDLVRVMFQGEGQCITVCNATIGLMLAIREAVDNAGNPHGRYALVPAFTFAATAHAAIWCGLTPILYDVDLTTWLPSMTDEQRLLDLYGEEIAVIVPYATFGNCLDLARYNSLSHGGRKVPVVVDAAASLGSLDANGQGFGSGSEVSVVYSMHVTKTFSTSEGGVIYSSDSARISRLRSMSNFGFVRPKIAELAGLNAKLSETAAVIARGKLAHFANIRARRLAVFDRYRSALPMFCFQEHVGQAVISQFAPLLLPRTSRHSRDRLIDSLAEAGIGAAKYFSPHLAEHPYFQKNCVIEPVPSTDDISTRCLSLPIFDTMSDEQVDYVSACLSDIVAGNDEGA